jgi:hypothetical protein
MIEKIQKLFSGVFESPEEDGDRDLSTAVDPNMEEIFLIEFEVNPRSTVRDDTGIIEDLSATMGFDLILIKKDSWGAVKLADDDPLCPVHNKRPIFCHERDFTKIDFLFFDRLDALRLSLFIDIPND